MVGHSVMTVRPWACCCTAPWWPVAKGWPRMPAPEKVLRGGRVRWRARYYDPSGQRHSKTFPTAAEASRFLAGVQHAKITGSYVDPNRSRVTLAEWAGQWLDSKLNLAPKTRDRYEGIIRAHIVPRWGKVRLSNVTHGELQRWIASIDAAPATVTKVHRVMSMLLAYAVADDRLAKNPAERISLPRVQQAERRYLTHTQVAELAEFCGPGYRLVVLFLAYTGLRWGEMAALRVGMVDFLRRRVMVAESVTPVHGTMTFGPTKGHERRAVPLPRFLVEDLAGHVAGKSGDDLVFTSLRGTALRSQTFQRVALTRAAESLGVPGFHPHELRHTAAS